MRNMRAIPVLAIVATVTGAVLLAAAQDQQGQREGRRRAFSAERLMEHDADGDGRLSREELPARVADRIFEQADADGDGLLTVEELQAFFAARGAGRRDRSDAAPARFDRSMTAMNRSLRRLSQSAFDGDTLAGDLDRVSDLQAALVAAKRTSMNVPMSEPARRRFGSDTAAYRKAIRLELHAALAESLNLEAALLDGDTVAALASLESIVAVRDRAHAVFQPQDG